MTGQNPSCSFSILKSVQTTTEPDAETVIASVLYSGQTWHLVFDMYQHKVLLPLMDSIPAQKKVFRHLGGLPC